MNESLASLLRAQLQAIPHRQHQFLSEALDTYLRLFDENYKVADPTESVETIVTRIWILWENNNTVQAIKFLRSSFHKENGIKIEYTKEYGDKIAEMWSKMTDESECWRNAMAGREKYVLGLAHAKNWYDWFLWIKGTEGFAKLKSY